jgi:hypothetical protein
MPKHSSPTRLDTADLELAAGGFWSDSAVAVIGALIRAGGDLLA